VSALAGQFSTSLIDIFNFVTLNVVLCMIVTFFSRIREPLSFVSLIHFDPIHLMSFHFNFVQPTTLVISFQDFGGKN